jgi:hypothetical protein
MSAAKRGVVEMSKKLTKTEEWMFVHPDDTPCPKVSWQARAWRLERGIIPKPGNARRDRLVAEEKAKYAQAMKETRAMRKQ